MGVCKCLVEWKLWVLFCWKSGHILKQGKTGSSWLEYIWSHFSAPIGLPLRRRTTLLHTQNPPCVLVQPRCSFLRDTHQILKTQCGASLRLCLFTMMASLNPPNIYQHPRGLVGISNIRRYSPLTLHWVKLLVAQSCLAFCNLMDCSPPVFFVHGILQARILEWVAIPFSRGSSQPRDQTCISCVSCIGRGILYCLNHQGSLVGEYSFVTESASECWIKIPEIINFGD